jgi:hypothetical protein
MRSNPKANSKHLLQLKQLLLDLHKSKVATEIDLPKVSAAQLEKEAQIMLSQNRQVARLSSKIVGEMFSPPVAPPVFSGSPGNALAELKIFLTTTGTVDLLKPPAERIQAFVVRASMLLNLDDIDVPVPRLDGLGARMRDGKLLETEISSSFVQSAIEAERCCSQRTEAFEGASSAPNLTMCTMLK